MQCVFYAQSEEKDACLLGHKRTICGAIKCLKTIGQPCSISTHEMKLTGSECANTLVCGCDRKCNGCMSVNGQEKCHFAEKCMPLHKRGGAESAAGMQQLGMPFEKPDSYEIMPVDDSGMVNFS
jgi:hypothetical protein